MLEVTVIYSDTVLTTETVLCEYISSPDINANLVCLYNGYKVTDIIKKIPRENIWKIDVKHIEKPKNLN